MLIRWMKRVAEMNFLEKKQEEQVKGWDRAGEGDDKSRDTEEEKQKRVEGKDRGEVCNSLLSPSPAPSPNLPRTINQIRRQTLIEDYHATGSTMYAHTPRAMEDLHATGSIHTHILLC